jgi:hypothetical protein
MPEFDGVDAPPDGISMCQDVDERHQQNEE